MFVVLLFVCGIFTDVNDRQCVSHGCVARVMPLYSWHSDNGSNGHLYLQCLNEAQSTGGCGVTLRTPSYYTEPGDAWYMTFHSQLEGNKRRRQFEKVVTF